MSLVRRDPTASERAGKGRVPTGRAEEIVISETTFRNGLRAFDQHAHDRPAKRQKREDRGDASIVYGDGAYKGPWRKYEEQAPDADSDSDASDVEYVEVYEEDELEEQPARPAALTGTDYAPSKDTQEQTEFLGTEERDYQGRTYMHVPQDLNINLRREVPYTERQNYLPKKQIHTFGGAKGGHAKAITSTLFFPRSGHLLLSGAGDSQVLLWDVYHQRELLRRFSGHTKAITALDFSPDGTEFLTASFDRQMKLWDTETGACKGRFKTGATPFCVKFNPSQPHEFLGGMSDNKIVQYDTRKEPDSKPEQEYDHHLGPINTIVFCDEDRRFLTTSDDKTLRAWEYGINVPIKLVADPSMYSMTRAALHPSLKHVAYQSMDNQVLMYSTGDKFRQNRKKGFRGHEAAGFSCGIDFSADGQYLASGDANGSLVLWDYKTCKLLARLSVADGAGVNTVAWHPQETSKLVTGDANGQLKYWD